MSSPSKREAPASKTMETEQPQGHKVQNTTEPNVHNPIPHSHPNPQDTVAAANNQAIPSQGDQQTGTSSQEAALHAAGSASGPPTATSPALEMTEEEVEKARELAMEETERIPARGYPKRSSPLPFKTEFEKDIEQRIRENEEECKDGSQFTESGDSASQQEPMDFVKDLEGQDLRRASQRSQASSATLLGDNYQQNSQNSQRSQQHDTSQESSQRDPQSGSQDSQGRSSRDHQAAQTLMSLHSGTGYVDEHPSGGLPGSNNNNNNELPNSLNRPISPPPLRRGVRSHGANEPPPSEESDSEEERERERGRELQRFRQLQDERAQDDSSKDS